MSKYKVGQRFIDAYATDLTYTILAVSPDIDYQGEHSYFVEMVSDKKDKWYNVVYDSIMIYDQEITDVQDSQ